MKLEFRNFYYLDSDYVDSLSGYLTGFVEEERSEAAKDENTNKGEAGLKLPFFNASGGIDSLSGKEITRKGSVNSEIRYNNLFDYLKQNGLEQVDSINEKMWDELFTENEYIEIKGRIQFTQIYDLERQMNIFGSLATDFGVGDKKENETLMSQAAKIRELQERNGIPLIVKTSDLKFQFIAYLNSKFIMKEQSDFVGNEYTVLCKIERKIPVDKKYKLFDLKDFENIGTTNRAQRRNKKKESMPKQLEESIKGPAAIILPIAIYR